MTEIVLNGKKTTTDAKTVFELIQAYGLEGKPIAVEIGGEVVNREEWKEKQIQSGMTIELVHFVGGG